MLETLQTHDRIMLNAPTGFGKSLLVLVEAWPRLQEGSKPPHQLYLCSKTKAQLQEVFLRNLLTHESFQRPPADRLVIAPLISRQDLCSQLSPKASRSDKDISQQSLASCHQCRARIQAHHLPRKKLVEVRELLQLGSYPCTFRGLCEQLAPYGCPSVLVRRILPSANVVLFPQGYLDTPHQLPVIEHFLTQATAADFPYQTRELIIDEAHHFGPMVDARLPKVSLEHLQSIGHFPMVEALLKLFDQAPPDNRVERPQAALPYTVTQIDRFMRQWGRARLLTPTDRRAFQEVRNFLLRRGQIWICNEDHLVQLHPFPIPLFEFLFTQFKRVVLLSGTFFQLDYYSQLYTGYGDTFVRLNVPQTEVQRHQLHWEILYHKAYSSEPAKRTPATYNLIADFIHRAVLLANDHTLIFVPSYDYLDVLSSLLEERFQEQRRVWCEPQKGYIPFLNQLKYGPPSIILGVYGGKFSEGVELRDPVTQRSRYRLLLLVGLPLPPPTAEYLTLFRLYWQKFRYRHLAEWALVTRILYAQIPQALGRAIRSEQDRAAAVILDHRAMEKLRFIRNKRYCMSPEHLLLRLGRILQDINQ